jgi:hypothetical protein
MTLRTANHLDSFARCPPPFHFLNCSGRRFSDPNLLERERKLTPLQSFDKKNATNLPFQKTRNKA